MAEESEDGQEKTEEPSQRKIEKAREDGKVLSSKEMFVFTGIFMALLLMFTLSWTAKKYLFEWADLFVFESDTSLDDLFIIKMRYALWYVLKIGVLIGTPLFVITVATQLAVGGMVFSPKAVAFKGEKLNILKGIKRMVSAKALVELSKAIAKVILLMGATSYVIYLSMPQILQMSSGSLSSALNQMQHIFPLLLIASLMALAVIAALDYFWQRHQHTDSLKMTRQEQKDEYKQTEGSPEVRAKIRRLQMESARKSAKQQEDLQNMGEATAIITNPTHFAIALKYDVGQLGAPKIIAMGKGLIAKRIMEIGIERNITSFRSPLLARALFFTGEIGEEISEKLYNAVAVALAYVYKLDRGENIDAPDIDVPEDLRFNENGTILKEN